MDSTSTRPPAPPLTGDALVGQKIFVQGQTASGPVRFTSGVNAGNGACANCHGVGGNGGSGPAIGWNHLTRKMNMPNMPKFVYATAAQVITVITTGVRPDGTKLKATMPRYELTAADGSAIVAFLQAPK
jgi:mono/diheme cytochrome c family protein